MGSGEASGPQYDENVSILHPAHRFFRFIFLATLCFMTFGSYWSYDVPGAIQDKLQEKYDLSQTSFNLLYVVYSFMNIGVVLFGGYFIDMIGLRSGSILFCAVITLGQIIFAIGSTIQNVHHAYYVMLAGRIVFSLGGESLSVAQSTFTSKWFKGNELAFAFGITLSFARVGSFANYDITPILASKFGISWAIWFSAFTCLISLALTVIAAYSDKIRDNHFNIGKTAEGEKETPKVPFKLTDVLHFPLSLWLIYLVCVFYYVPVFNLISNSGLPYLQALFPKMTQTVGNRYLSIPYMMSAVLAPICGFLVDKIGRKPLFLWVASTFMVGSYAILLFGVPAVGNTYMVIIAVVLLGLSYSLCAASLWPCVPLLVAEERVGSAYAIMNSIQNAGLAIAGVVTGELACPKKVTAVYCDKRPIEFLGLVSVVATGFAVVLTLQDAAKGGTLAKRSEKLVEITEETPSEKSPLLYGSDQVDTRPLPVN